MEKTSIAISTISEITNKECILDNSNSCTSVMLWISCATKAPVWTKARSINTPKVTWQWPLTSHREAMVLWWKWYLSPDLAWLSMAPNKNKTKTKMKTPLCCNYIAYTSETIWWLINCTLVNPGQVNTTLDVGRNVDMSTIWANYDTNECLVGRQMKSNH